MAKREDFGHSFLAYFKRATSPLAVLRILSDRPMYGYELIQELKPVSYTHLDVYKRQNMGRSLNRISASRPFCSVVSAQGLIPNGSGCRTWDSNKYRSDTTAGSGRPSRNTGTAADEI